MPLPSPPYIAMYAAMNSLLPAIGEAGYQSLLVNTPSVFLAPTLSGNSVGELAPFDMNSHFGLNFSWIIALTCANASSDCVPETRPSGFAAATPPLFRVRPPTSRGYEQ